MRWYCGIFFLLLFTMSFSSLSSPRLLNPVFQSLSTKNGLPQDVVNDIVVDKQGFVWIATDGGLVRWDGVRSVEIKGPNDILLNATVNKIALEGNKALWVSTYSSGVFRIDLATQAITTALEKPYRNIPDWIQNVESFTWNGNSKLVMALQEEVVQFDTRTQTFSTLYAFSDEKIKAKQIIRYAMVIDEVLVVATTNGIEGIDLSTPDSGAVAIDYLDVEKSDEDSLNAKWLMLDEKDRFWVGTVKGLFHTTKSELINFVKHGALVSFLQVVEARNIWTMKSAGEDRFWLGTNKGLYELALTEEGWENQHILEPHNGRTELSDKKIRSIAADDMGNLWLSSVYAGALYFGVKSIDIYAIQSRYNSAEKVLSDNTVWALAQRDKNSLWIGTENGLNHYNFSARQSQQFLVSDDDEVIAGESMIKHIVPMATGQLFIQTDEGIRLFDPDTSTVTLPPVRPPFDNTLFNEWLPSVVSAGPNAIYFVSGDGFYRYHLQRHEITPIELDKNVFDVHFFVGFLGRSAYHDNRMLVAMEGGVWLVDMDTFEHELVFRFSEKQRSIGRSVSSWAIDDNNVLWLGFSGYGLYGIDANTFEPLYELNQTNLLMSDIVYGLQKDAEGALWFSSHSGIHKYSPATAQIHNFIYGRELSVSEFNEGAALTLRDGRLAYGSTSGVVVFSPLQISRASTELGLLSRQTAITELALESRVLSLPLTNLNGQRIELDHEDHGLTVYFSAMTMNQAGGVKFHYKLLKDNKVVSEGVTDDNKVALANLEPGDYRFTVGPTPGSFEYTVLPAEIFISMPYAPLSSPLAFTVYIVIAVLLLVGYLLSRQRQLFRLQSAQKQVILFSDAFRQTRDWVIILDKNKVPVAANPAFETVFGFNEREPLPKQLSRLFTRYPMLHKHLLGNLTHLKGGEFWKGEGSVEGADGKQYDVLIEITAISDDNQELDHFLLILSDITEQKNAERKLLKIANYDSLTGLVNRSLLLDRLEHALGHARQHHHRVAVMFVDLDRFKGINDSLGHDYGDKLLRVVANRMRNLVSDSGTVARLGGDEFVIVIEEVDETDDLISFVGQLIESVETPISLANEMLRISCSLGVAFYPDDASEAAELIKQADVAMYIAKKDTLNGFAYFTKDMNEKAKQRLNTENLVKRAYSEACFYNAYQPIVDAENKRTVGVELLLRGTLDDAPLYPDVFIPILEQLRYIIDVTRQALRRATSDLAQWYEQGFDGFISVNLSALHFKTELDIDSVIKLLNEYNLPKKALRFEITEGVLMDDSDIAYRQIKRLVDNGFILALDDFGTGYSSLSYLKRYPLSVLKIDKSFVNEVAPGNANDALVSTTITLASSLHMHSVAEGVETQAQADYLLAKGCRYHQGYLYAKAMSKDAVTPLLFKRWK
ncbi:EAL domain-containing protein [Alteromonas sp. 345S023]|uniref:EAL domain-containing protein n=1 Tax=Alteromonas profundi TaxID=2696062 RepID=A0A7X5RK61_9ALTE|nr:EAL domain-containing protein [Alteromonas profundi]NDV90648.1 EAL domain-containing protein [Alteromonas profundi]